MQGSNRADAAASEKVVPAWQQIATTSLFVERDEASERLLIEQRGGENWIVAFSSYELLETVQGPGDDGHGVDHAQMTGRQLRDQLPTTVGIIYKADVDTEHQVSPPAATPVVRVAAQ